MASFDLLYMRENKSGTMACVVKDSSGTHMIGPFPASVAGPKIVAELHANPELGFDDLKCAELAYIAVHFGNMSRGHNDVGQDYPHRIGDKTP